MGSKGGGGSTQTTTTNNQPPAQFLNAFTNATNQAQQVASTPFQQYPGNLLAPLSPDQQSGISLTESTPGIAQPYINSAATDLNTAGGYMEAATNPLWPSTQQFSPGAVQQYMSPFTTDVVNATQAQFANQNAQQQQGLAGQAISAGAWGGDRAGVAQGILGGQQALAEAPTIAGLENTGYQTGLGEFNTEQQAQLGANEANAWLNSQAGYGLANLGAGEANLGNEALGSTLTAANSLLGIGGLEQSQAQAGLNIPYEQFTAAQAYPFQSTGWLANIEEGLGSGAGGTSSTTSPGPSLLSELGGLGLGTAGILGQSGAFNGLGTSIGNLFGGSSSADALSALDSMPAASAEDTAAASSLFGPTSAGIDEGLAFGAARGGIIPRRASGGTMPPMGSTPPMGSATPIPTGIPNVDVNIVPSGTSGGKPLIGGNFGTTSTTTGSGGGGGAGLADAQAGIGAAAGIGSIVSDVLPLLAAARGGIIPREGTGHGIVIPFPGRRRATGGGILGYHNDNGGYREPARRAAGGGATASVTTTPSSTPGLGAIPTLNISNSGAPAGGTGSNLDAVNAYLANTQATASTAPPKTAPQPAPPAPPPQAPQSSLQGVTPNEFAQFGSAAQFLNMTPAQISSFFSTPNSNPGFNVNQLGALLGNLTPAQAAAIPQQDIFMAANSGGGGGGSEGGSDTGPNGQGGPFRRGGIIPRRDTGGGTATTDSSGVASELLPIELSEALANASRRGGAISRDDGGSVPPRKHPPRPVYPSEETGWGDETNPRFGPADEPGLMANPPHYDAGGDIPDPDGGDYLPSWTPPPTPFQKGILMAESGDNQTGGITGDNGQAAGPGQVHQGAIDDVNKRLGTHYTFQQARDNPAIGDLISQTYAQMQQDSFKNPAVAAAAYNAGPGAVQNAMDTGQPIPGADYAKKVTGFYPPGGGNNPPPPQQQQTQGIVPPPSSGGITGNVPNIPVPKMDPWETLTAAGFGMMAGRSPFALENVGTGGEYALKDLQEQRQNIRQAQTENIRAGQEEERTQAEIKRSDAQAAHEGATLAQSAEQFHARLQDEDNRFQQQQTTEQQRLTEEARHNAAMENTGSTVSGYGTDPNTGQQVPGLYRIPKDPSQKPIFTPGVITAQHQRIITQQEQATARQQLGQANLDERTANDVLTRATSLVTNDLTGKMTLPQAVQQVLQERKAAAPAARPAPANPAVPAPPTAQPAPANPQAPAAPSLQSVFPWVQAQP